MICRGEDCVLVHVSVGDQVIYVEALESGTTVAQLKNEVGDVDGFGGSYTFMVQGTAGGPSTPVMNPDLTLRDLAGAGNATLRLFWFSAQQAGLSLTAAAAAAAAAAPEPSAGRARFICGSGSASSSAPSRPSWPLISVGLLAGLLLAGVLLAVARAGRHSRRLSARR
jgi:hypothetical protein